MIEIIKDKKDIDAYFDVLSKRGTMSGGKYLPIVQEIINDVIENGDDALIKYTKKFDAKYATINFKFPNMSGTYTISPKGNNVKYDYIYKKSISWLNPHIKFLPEFIMQCQRPLI